jgi:hypothetical protein
MEKVNPFFGKVNYDDYVIHTTTSNKSFIQMFKTLKSLGIENNKFFLRLYDKDLMHVDPLSKRLTHEQKTKVINEIIRNPYYYIREVVRIPAPGANLKFELHRGNLAITWAIFNNINQIVVLPRQRGKTISIAVALSHIYHFGTTNTNMIFSNKSGKDAENNLKRLKDITLLLPDYLKESILSPKDANNIEYIWSYSRNNRILTSGEPRGAEEADKMGRGQTVPEVWYDEYAFLKYNSIIYAAAGPAQSRIAEVAKANGKPHSKIISTTPNNIDVPAGEECYKMIQESAKFIEKMYDWNRNEIDNYIQQNSNNDFIYIEFTWQQLGLTEEWYRKECRVLNNKLLLIRRELDLEWTKSSDNSVFSEEQLDVIGSYHNRDYTIMELKPKFRIFNEELNQEETVNRTYFMNVYRPLNPKKTYLVGCDVGGGLGRDNSTMVVVDPEDLMPVAIFKNNKINTSYFTSLIEYVMEEVLPLSIFIIERNNYGLNVIDTLVRTKSKRLFYTYSLQDKDKTKNVTKDNIKYGVDTSVKSREIMFDNLFTLVNEEPHVLGVDDIYNEVRTLEYNKQGKIEHNDISHDDCLLGYLIVRYALSNTPTGHLLVKKIRNNHASNQSGIANSIFGGVDDPTINKYNIASNLTIDELIYIKDNNISVDEFISSKYNIKTNRPKLKINNNILNILRK